jgi:hypothetical protein
MDRIRAHEQMIRNRGRNLIILGILGLLAGTAQFLWDILPIPYLDLALAVGGLVLVAIGVWQFIWLARVDKEARDFTRAVLDYYDRTDPDA